MHSPRRHRGRAALRRGRSALLSALALCFLLPEPSFASESFYARIVLNRKERGDFLVDRSESQGYLLRLEDWNSIGLKDGEALAISVEGERLVPVASVPGLAAAFDEPTMTLDLAAEPSLFPGVRISLARPRHDNVLRPLDDSAFLNYGVQVTGRDGSRSYLLPSELGVRRGEYLFVNGGYFRSDPGTGSGYTRLQTTLVRDRRETLERFALGDAAPSSGLLGSGLRMGGISYSKEYRMDPYLVRVPTAGVSGTLRYPSEARIYVDNVPVATEYLPPGPFQLRDLQYYGGSGDVRVVLKDPFGREEEVRSPFYFTDELLKAGLHEYSYNAGFLREGAPDAGDRYGKAAFSFFHRHGFSDETTAGFRGEGAGNRFNLGPTWTRKLGTKGVVTAALAAGRGAAALLGYGWQGGRVTFRGQVEGRTAGYRTAATEGEGTIRTRLSAGAGYATRGTGSFSLDLSSVGRDGAPRRTEASASWSRTFRGNWSVHASLRHVAEAASNTEAALTVMRFLGEGTSATARAAAGSGTNRESAEYRKPLPAGEGSGYAFRAERATGETGSFAAFSPSAQYNGRYASLSGDVDLRSGTGAGTAWRFSAAGALLTTGGMWDFSRPATDSFAVAVVPGVPGVRVSQNGQVMGRTDARGRVTLPNLASYFENQVSIEDKDVPIDYRLGAISRFVSPPLRSGSRILFDAVRIQAVTGYLDIISPDGRKAAEYADATLEMGWTRSIFPTGKGGEFYLENVAPGDYTVRILLGGNRYVGTMRVPESTEMIVEVGRIGCEASED